MLVETLISACQYHFPVSKVRKLTPYTSKYFRNSGMNTDKCPLVISILEL